MKKNLLKAFSILDIIISLSIGVLFVLTIFQLITLIKNYSSINYQSTECLAIASSKLETIMYNSHLLTLKKVGASYPIYNLIDQQELNYNSSFDVYQSFRKHYLSNQIPYYFYSSYSDFRIATRIRLYSQTVQNFYTVTVYCYHRNNPKRVYSLTTILKSRYSL
jgi:hypothetical protein